MSSVLRLPLARKPLSSLIFTATTLGLLAAASAPTLADEKEDSSKNLNKVVVSDSVVREGTTEGNDSYTTRTMGTSIGLNLSVRETPQSVSVVTRQQIEDQNLDNSVDVLLSSPGISMSRSDSNRFALSSRGFSVTNFQFDGLASPINNYWNYGATDMDSAIYDRVEIVRGSAGLLNGSGNPSATVNFIRKRPLQEFAFSGSLAAGSRDHYRGEVDVSVPFTEGGKVAGRFVVSAADRDSHVTFLDFGKETLYGVVSADITDRTNLTAGIEYQENTSHGMSSGFPLFYSDGTRTDFDRSVANNTKWAEFATENATSFLDFEHYFENAWRIRVTYSHNNGNYGMEYLWRGGYPSKETGLGMPPSFIKYRGDRKRDDIHLELAGEVEWFNRSHQLAFGWMSIDDDNEIRRQLPIGDVPVVGSYLNWREDHIAKPTWNPEGTVVDDMAIKQAGGYGVARLSLADPLTLIIGARLSNWETDQTYFGTLTKYRFNNELTPYAGLVYDINRNFSVYTSFTEIFTQQNARSENGRLLDPIGGQSYEAGVKGSWFDSRLNAAAAIYKSKQDGLAEAIPGVTVVGQEDLQAYRAVDGAEVEGYELEVAGKITDNWNLTASYTEYDAEDARGNPMNTSHPRKMFKAFTSYNFDGVLSGLTIGGGANWQDSIYRSAASPNGNVVVSQGSYTVANLMARYEFDQHLSAQINVTNAFDKKYYEQVGFYSQGWWGEPRKAVLTVKYRY